MSQVIKQKLEGSVLWQYDNLLMDDNQLAEVEREFSEKFRQLESVINERQICNECGRKRMYFCYDCRLFMDGVDKFAPQIQLQAKVDIIKHPLELNGKSTAVHCCLTASTSTAMYNSVGDMPDYSKIASSLSGQERVVVVYPSKSAVSVEDFVAVHGPIDRFVILDGTWNNVGALVKLPQLQGLPFVTLKKYRTQYWRQQPGLTDDHLATIEAIYHVVREHEEALKRLGNDNSAARGGKLSDLLFWFYFFRSRVDWQRYRNKQQK